MQNTPRREFDLGRIVGCLALRCRPGFYPPAVRAASKGFSSNSVYSATKAAVRSFVRTWTTDLKERRIRVNAVSPGCIDTPGLSDLLPSSEVGEQQKKLISNTVPLGRFGTPDEIAKAVVSRIRRITGIELFVDGGVAQV